MLTLYCTGEFLHISLFYALIILLGETKGIKSTKLIRYMEEVKK